MSNISVYTVTADCQVQSEVPLLFAVNFKCEFITFISQIYHRFTVYIAVPEILNITAIIVTYELSGNLKRITTTLSKKQVRKTYTNQVAEFLLIQNTTDENGLTVI